MSPSQVGIGVAFAAGLLSFLSPCVLPLVPIYLAQLVGQSVYQAGKEEGAYGARLATFLHAAVFVLGFTFTFIALGATASALGSFLNTHQVILRQVGGVLLVIIGLQIAGFIRLPFVSWQKRIEFHPDRPAYSASLLVGIIFGLAWSPCYGPILAVILGLAASAATLKQGVFLLLAYSMGLGVPFLLLGLGIDQMSRFLKWLKPHLHRIEIGTGILLVLVGVLIFFNLLAQLNQYFNTGLIL